jgi:hypothetical protein
VADLLQLGEGDLGGCKRVKYTCEGESYMYGGLPHRMYTIYLVFMTLAYLGSGNVLSCWSTLFRILVK